MLITPHLLVGAALGGMVGRPALALALGLGSHFVLDYIPHLDAHGAFGSESGAFTALEATAVLVDVALGVTLLLWLGRRARMSPGTWAGALGAVLIDAVDHLSPWGEWFSAWSPTAPISAFHHAFQQNLTPAEWPLGLATQVLVTGASLAVLLRGRQPRESAAPTSTRRRE